ncbi:MAG: cytochrome c biogenesis protein ResB [Candidatus Eremiobacteraeota bacterium]|nr:cytochrome c biogenesis protein ResB [Candidatus Eremiobacteraeota bacterium]
MREYYDDFLRTFSNVLFAVLLFAVWGLLTGIGVVVDQGKDAVAYFAAYPAPIARLILRLGFDNVYHGPAYVGIIGLILLSLAVCTFRRVIPARLPPLRPLPISNVPLNATLSVPGSENAVRQAVRTFFAKRGWQIRKREFGGLEWTFADKHNWARRGVLVAHVGFVIIAAGTTIYWARGFSGEAAVVSGQTVEIPQTHATLRLDDFHYRIQPILTKSGMVYQPIDYVSHVTVVGNDGVPRRATIRVNHPIDVDGTLYYQSSYGFAMRFLVTHNGKVDRPLSNRTYEIGDTIAIPQTKRTISFSQFIPTIDRASGQPSSDPRVNNPGAVLAVNDGDQALGAALVPLRTWIAAGSGWRITPQRAILLSGLQYRYDPGVPLVGIGAFVLLAGLLISFYLLPARLYVRVAQSATHPNFCEVGVAATTVKGYDIFEVQFNELLAALERETLPTDPKPRLSFAKGTA